MKVLVIRFSSIGDIVLTTPVVRCLRQQHPGWVIHFLTKQSFAPLLAYNPHIDKIFYLGDDLAATTDQLKKEKYDCIIDLHHNLRTLRVKRALGVKSYAFDKLNIKKWLLTNLKLDLMPDKSIVDRYFEAIKPLGVTNDCKGLDYFLPTDKALTNKDIPMSHWGGFVGCVIGGSYATKKLPVARWKEFCAQVPFPIMLLGGPEDLSEGLEIAAADPVRIYNSCGKFNLNESAELVKYARVIVSNDTGLMHIAAAFRKPIISLWGNTSPAMGMFPYYGFNNLRERVAPQSFTLENKALSCHPCSKLGYKKCPKGHFRCMNDLDMQLAATQVMKYWRDGSQA